MESCASASKEDDDPPQEHHQTNGAGVQVAEDDAKKPAMEDNAQEEKSSLDGSVDLAETDEVEGNGCNEDETKRSADGKEAGEMPSSSPGVTKQEPNAGETSRPEDIGSRLRDETSSNSQPPEGTKERDGINGPPADAEAVGSPHRRLVVDLSHSGALQGVNAVVGVREGWTENGRQGGGGGASKSVDFSMDEVDIELARVIVDSNGNGAVSEEQLMFDPHDYGRGATTNTPVTVMTDYAESFSQIQGRGLHTPSNDHIYQHALSIMKKRCRSSRTATTSKTCATSIYGPPQTPANVVEEEGGLVFPNFSLPAVVANMDRPPLVQNANCFFYVTQSRQHPIAPVKAWKGYDSNLYFQPMVCKKANLTLSSTPRENALNKATRRAYSTPLAKTKPAEGQAEHLPQLPQPGAAGEEGQSSVAPSAAEARSVASWRTTAAPGRPRSLARAASTARSSRASTARQLAILDKQSVFSLRDSNLREDIQWISGLESMGTLHLGGLDLPRSTARFYRNTGKHHKLKIQRGLVSHRLAAGNQSLPTLLGVHGGRLNDSADSVAKTKHLQSQYQAPPPGNDNDDRPAYSSNLFGGYSGPFSSFEQLRRDSSASPRRGDTSPSSDQLILKDDSLHSLASVFKNPGNAMPLYSSKEVLFRNREALFLTRPNYR